MSWYVYILECQDTSLYTGVTDNLERRFKEHVSGKGGTYTENNRPIKILHFEVFQEKVLADSREKQIKRWSRVKKLTLAQGNFDKLKTLSVSRD